MGTRTRSQIAKGLGIVALACFLGHAIAGQDGGCTLAVLAAALVGEY